MKNLLQSRAAIGFAILLALVLLLWVVTLCQPKPKPVPRTTEPITSQPGNQEAKDRATLDSLNQARY